MDSEIPPDIDEDYEDQEEDIQEERQMKLEKLSNK